MFAEPMNGSKWHPKFYTEPLKLLFRDRFSCRLPPIMAAMKAAMKAAKAMKAMKAKKAMKVSKVAKGKRAKSSVFKGTKVKTSGGLSKADLVKSKTGKIVSKKASARAKKNFQGSK